MLSKTNEDCRLTTVPYIIDIKDKKEFFKPGLPYHFEVCDPSKIDVVLGFPNYLESYQSQIPIIYIFI